MLDYVKVPLDQNYFLNLNFDITHKKEFKFYYLDDDIKEYMEYVINKKIIKINHTTTLEQNDIKKIIFSFNYDFSINALNENLFRRFVSHIVYNLKETR